jgi:hypothetical protein
MSAGKQYFHYTSKGGIEIPDSLVCMIAKMMKNNVKNGYWKSLRSSV